MLTTGPIPSHAAGNGLEIISPTWDRRTISALYAAADLFVLPSRLETWGDVLLEAMSFGLPCIGVSGQAMEEIIADGLSGLLVDEEDVFGLAAGLVRLLTDVDLRRRMGRQARLRVEEQYTWTAVVQRLSDCLYQTGVVG